ncbi:MAG: Endolytic murein transglycosylase [Acidobacteria bacterium]|nr:Endolytic murein transglycosylase [Acidobacteriota bacterium]
MKRLLFIFIVVVVLCAGGIGYWGYKDLHTPVRHSRSEQYVEIPRGAAPASVVRKLASEGVITHEWPLKLYMKFSGSGTRLRAGEYMFPSPISPLGVLRKLQLGEQRTMRLTIIEGWTRWDIASAMARVPEFELADPDEALKLMNDVSLIKSVDPEATNLEGYLYPDTYEFPPGTSPRVVIEMMVKRFLMEWSPENAAKARALNLTPRQIATTGSLIETEAKLKDERPIIASVIYNRLKRNMPLGVDSSIIYASKLAGKWKNDGKVYKSDVDRVSPYNTRLFAGLPPGPIASFGASSLEAALNPAKTEFLFYVRDPARNDGAHNFYANDSDFSHGVQALRNWERQRDAANAARGAPTTP